MTSFAPERFGLAVESARKRLGLSQLALAERLTTSRSQVSRMESGKYVPRFDEAVALAEALRVPLQWLLDGRWQPKAAEAEAIVFELYQMGVRDLSVVGASIPGAFRHGEEVLALALRGDRPDPRFVDAIPFVLARHRFNVPLLIGFGGRYDRRVRRRVGWLADVALSLSGIQGFPAVRWPEVLTRLSKGVTPPDPDGLGHPDDARLPPLWRKWNVTYAGRPADFLRRAAEIQDAIRHTPALADEGES